MSDIDEKILESIDWTNDKNGLLDDLDNEIEDLLEEQVHISYRLEQLQKIKEMVKTDAYYTTPLKKYTNEVDIVNTCASYAANGAGLRDMLTEAMNFLLPAIQATNRDVEVTLSLIPLQPDVQYDPTLYTEHFREAIETHILYEGPSFRFMHNPRTLDGVPYVFYDTWNDCRYVTLIDVTQENFGPPSGPYIRPNSPWFHHSHDRSTYIFIHKDNAHFIIHAHNSSPLSWDDWDYEEENEYEEEGEYEEEEE